MWGDEVYQEGDEPIAYADGVNIIAGEHVRRALSELGEVALSPEETDRIYDKLTEAVDLADRRAERDDEHGPTLTEQAEDWLKRFLVGASGFWFALVSLSLGWWFLVASIVLLALGLAARTRTRLRPYAVPWIIGSQTVTVVVLIAALLSLFIEN